MYHHVNHYLEWLKNPPHTSINCRKLYLSLALHISRGYISSSRQAMQVHSCSIYISLNYLHFDDYLFCQQPSKKGEIVGAMIGPLCFGVCWHKQFGTYVFASAHKVTGPWDSEEFDANDGDNLPVVQRRLSPKIMITRVTRQKLLKWTNWFGVCPKKNDRVWRDWRRSEDVAFISFFFFFSLLSHRTTVLIRGV